MNDCPFQLNASGLWQCPECGWVFPRKSDKPPYRNCPATITDEDRRRMAKMRNQMPSMALPEPTPEQKTEQEKQQKQLQAEGKRLGWTPAMVGRYAKALTRWVAAGRPLRSDEEVKRIFEQHCKPCEKYKADEDRCSVCGCKILTPGLAVLSKIRLSTEACPEGKWPRKSAKEVAVLPTMIAVAGPNRSGTSCVAGMLHKLGVSMGNRFIPTNGKNPTGYFEEIRLQRFLQKTFRSTDMPNNSFEDRVSWFCNWSKMRRETFIVGCKHPSLCLILPEMAQVWKQLKIVAVSRPTTDSVDSLKRVHWYNHRRAHPDQLIAARDEAIKSLSLPALHLHYHDVLCSPAATVEQLIDFTGIECSKEQQAKAIAHVRPELCHINPPRRISPLSREVKGPVDVVYPLSNGSRWNDNELRYSLRSLEKYATNLGRIFVIGRKPTWLTGVVHIPMNDVRRLNKDANIINKIRRAIAEGISDRFIFASDDQYLVASCDLATLPVTHGCGGEGKSRWWRRVHRTKEYLISQGKPDLFYDTHLFQPHWADEFEQACRDAPYEQNPGFAINTLIYNSGSHINSVPSGQIRGKLVRSHNEVNVSDMFKNELAEMFSVPSRFELPLSSTVACKSPRVFTFWTGPMPPLIRLCLKSMRKNIPDIEIWDLDQWRTVYDGRFGPWKSIFRRRPNVQSDLLRYWLLATYGGIWLDADFIAFRDVRAAWDDAVEYMGYLESRRRDMPYTAFMGAPLGSRITAKQCEFAREILGRSTIGKAAGPRLTLRAIQSCPDVPVRMHPRELFHPIIWHRWLRRMRRGQALTHQFSPDGFGLMLLHRIVNHFHGMPEKQLMKDSTAIGQALRKSFQA